MPANFVFVNDLIIREIKHLNQRLEIAGELQKATYYMELKQDVLFTEAGGYVFDLTLMRQENRVRQFPQVGTGLLGAVQMICSYKLKFLPDETTHIFDCDIMSEQSGINTYYAADSLNNAEHYFHKKYASLLIHVAVLCGAYARKRMNICAIHPYTATVYRKYDDYSEWDTVRFVRDNLGDTWPEKTNSVYTESCDQSRCINAAKNKVNTTSNDLQVLTDSKLDSLIERAKLEINSIIKTWSIKPNFFLDRPFSTYLV